MIVYPFWGFPGRGRTKILALAEITRMMHYLELVQHKVEFHHYP